ncbi:hypothetical protein ACFLUV_06610 [Elusimicrobiota bacterium]
MKTEITSEQLHEIIVKSIKGSEARFSKTETQRGYCRTSYITADFKEQPVFDWGIAFFFWSLALLIILFNTAKKRYCRI